MGLHSGATEGGRSEEGELRLASHRRSLPSLSPLPQRNPFEEDSVEGRLSAFALTGELSVGVQRRQERPGLDLVGGSSSIPFFPFPATSLFRVFRQSLFWNVGHLSYPILLLSGGGDG